MQLAQDATELVVPLPVLQRRFSAKIALVNSQEYDLNLRLTACVNGSPAAEPVSRLLASHGELITSLSDLFGGPVPAGAVISIKTDVGLASIYGVRPGVSGLA